MTLQNLDMAEVGALVGDPARANILAALMDGRALTAKELAYLAGVTPQTTSGHLARLTDANLLALAKRGRYRYPYARVAWSSAGSKAVATPAPWESPPKAGAALRTPSASTSPGVPLRPATGIDRGEGPPLIRVNAAGAQAASLTG